MNGETCFFDTYALIEISRASESYKRFAGLPILTSVMHAYEFFYYALKSSSAEKAEEDMDLLNCNYTPIEFEDVVRAAKFKWKHKAKGFSYIDCLGYVMAKRHGLKFLTGDKEFENLENVEFVK